MRANTLGDIQKTTDYKPLDKSNFDEYYVNCSDSRGETDTTKRLKNDLISLKDNPHKFLFTGHKGCGKSTELMRLTRMIKNDFLVISFSAQDNLDLHSLSYVDIIFESMRQLYEKAIEEKADIDPKILDNIYKWLSSVEVKETKVKSKELELQAGGKLKALKLLFVDFHGRFKYAGETKKEVTTFFNRRFAELVLHCITMINDVQKKLKKPVLIIIEDLDKLNLDQAREVFFDHGGQITALNCHMIFTFPISLRYCPDFRVIEGYFRKTSDLPMIKIQSAEGREKLEQIIEKRVNPDLFASNVLDKLIEKSGGSLRDLFRILQESASFAQEKDQTKITATAFERGAKEVKKSFEYSLSERREGGKIIIKADQYFEKLKEVSNNPRFLDKDQVLMDLLHNRSILLYENGAPWYDLHPLVKEILDDRNQSETA